MMGWGVKLFSFAHMKAVPSVHQRHPAACRHVIPWWKDLGLKLCHLQYLAQVGAQKLFTE